MITIYEDIEEERERIQSCIKAYGWTSDHNLDWFLDCAINEEGKARFVEFEDKTGILAYEYQTEWSVWSDPLCDKSEAAGKILELVEEVLKNNIKELWLVDVADNIRGELIQKGEFHIGDVWYSLLWPIMNMHNYDPLLPGGHFKEIRNARNKFYREHQVTVVSPSDISKDNLHRIVENWKTVVTKRPDIYELKYHKAIEDNFKAFKTARVMVVDGQPVGFNAGYDVPNHSNRFAGIIGIHDYSLKDLGLILWLEDLEWIKNAGYTELDMQGSEDDGGLKFKMQFNPTIERRTDCFSISKKSI